MDPFLAPSASASPTPSVSTEATSTALVVTNSDNADAAQTTQEGIISRRALGSGTEPAHLQGVRPGLGQLEYDLNRPQQACDYGVIKV